MKIGHVFTNSLSLGRPRFDGAGDLTFQLLSRLSEGLRPQPAQQTLECLKKRIERQHHKASSSDGLGRRQAAENSGDGA